MSTYTDHPINTRSSSAHVPVAEAISSLSMVVEARDPYTAGHQWRVSRFARLIADYAQLPRPLTAVCELAGFIHDVGKIGIPDAILQKPDRLDDNEFVIMKTHPIIGRELIWPDSLDALIVDTVHHHHERPDGKGYPDGLNESAISIPATIVGLCDALDALTSDRPYHKGMPLSRALGIIREERGRQFATRWVDVLLDEVPIALLHHIVGHSYPGIPLFTCPVCQGPIARFEYTKAPIDACRICGAELVESERILKPTGRKAPAEALIPRADKTIVADIINRCLLESEPI